MPTVPVEATGLNSALSTLRQDLRRAPPRPSAPAPPPEEAPRTLRAIVGLFFLKVFELEFHLCAVFTYRYRK